MTQDDQKLRSNCGTSKKNNFPASETNPFYRVCSLLFRNYEDLFLGLVTA